jgi:hypothetical protein
MSMLACMGPRHVSSPPPSCSPHCPHLPTMQSPSQIRMFTDFVLNSWSLRILSHHQTIEVSFKDDFIQFSFPNLKLKLCFPRGTRFDLGALLPDDVARVNLRCQRLISLLKFASEVERKFLHLMTMFTNFTLKLFPLGNRMC